jgi:hypothetical protein
MNLVYQLIEHPVALMGWLLWTKSELNLWNSAFPPVRSRHPSRLSGPRGKKSASIPSLP